MFVIENLQWSICDISGSFMIGLVVMIGLIIGEVYTSRLVTDEFRTSEINQNFTGMNLNIRISTVWTAKLRVSPFTKPKMLNS